MTKKTIDIQKLADYAMLHLEPSQVENSQRDFERTLSLFEQLSQVDTSQVSDQANPQLDPQGRQQAVTRADQVTESNQREALQADSLTASGVYLVPKVIE